MSSHISSAAQSSREQARQADGKFGPQTHERAGNVTLDPLAFTSGLRADNDPDSPAFPDLGPGQTQQFYAEGFEFVEAMGSDDGRTVRVSGRTVLDRDYLDEHGVDPICLTELLRDDDAIDAMPQRDGSLQLSLAKTVPNTHRAVDAMIRDMQPVLFPSSVGTGSGVVADAFKAAQFETFKQAAQEGIDKLPAYADGANAGAKSHMVQRLYREAAVEANEEAPDRMMNDLRRVAPEGSWVRVRRDDDSYGNVAIDIIDPSGRDIYDSKVTSAVARMESGTGVDMDVLHRTIGDSERTVKAQDVPEELTEDWDEFDQFDTVALWPVHAERAR